MKLPKSELGDRFENEGRIVGARGKKRKRADGSVADGRDKYMSEPEWTYDPVSTQALSMAMTIRNRFFPIDRQAYAEMVERVGELDMQYELASDDLAALAGTTGADEEALGVRAEQLWIFLREPDAAEFYTVTPEGEVRVDADLLAYVANKRATASLKDKVAWPIAV